MGFQETLRENITEKIVEAMKGGVPPWRKPWIDGSQPKNLVTKKSYRGINTILLAIHQWQHELTSPIYATYKQWEAIGCYVRKRPAHIEAGNYGASIVYFNQVKGKKEIDGEMKEFTFPLMKSYNVFNSNQVEGADEWLAKNRKKEEPKTPAELHEIAESVISTYTDSESIKVLNADKASYIPREDIITMPKREAFTMGVNSYYGTFFHECAHSTAIKSRTGRLERFERFGSASYAMEELVAEMAGCYLLGAVGLPILDKLENHASYLDSWLKVLQEDHKKIFQAATAASAAADYILKSSGMLEVEEEEELAVA